MSAIVTKYVADHKLSKDMSDEELSQHAPALLELLTDKLKRDKGRQRFRKGYEFSKEQAFILVPDQRICRSRSQVTPQMGGSEAGEVNLCQISDLIPGAETVEMIAQRIAQNNLSEKDVESIAKALSESASNDSAGLSRLTRLRRELRNLGVSEKIISATLIPERTRSANKIQKERREQRENEGIDFPDHFSLESVKERLDLYDVSNTPDVQALADVMIMLCIRPAEVKDLRISNGSVTGYSKNRDQQDNPRVFRSLERDEERAKLLLTWIQDAISSGQLRDPGVRGVKWFNTFLKRDRFLPETGKPLLPSYLRKLGAVFAVVSNGAKNLSEAMTIAGQALQHSPDNHASPAQNYTIINFRRKGQAYDQAKAFRLFDEN
ncbi:hypothetical protein RhiirA5_383044 [Rhizophagus irregularis]|uniref:Uncharacterized protein n=1 Tax=Rhizophagus irregularis TaxID=588596 RepID=A0A2N0NYI5_9GLOM|nr:hypothetical protein RhiirA5_383044 [Rhizophagus irregularis]